MYAVRKGRKCGIFDSWEEAKESVSGFSGAEFKKVKSREDAEIYLNGGYLKSKYVYACKNTRKVYNSWEQCAEDVKGVSGAIYKKFHSEEEALDWLNGVDEAQFGIINKKIPTVYIDGTRKDDKIGFGVVLVQKGTVTQFSGQTDGEMGNISGELSALLFTLHLLKRLGIKSANIVYDYDGIYKWISGEYKARTKEQQDYRDFAKEFTKSNELQLFYYNCKSHSGNKFNDLADRVAKQSLVDGKFYPKDLLLDYDLSL